MKHLFAVTFVGLTATLITPALAQQMAGKPNPEGEALYRSNCAFCHGVTGKGGRGPDLTGRRNMGSSDAEVKALIKNGIPGTTMPAFGDFAPDDLERLVAFVAHFQQRGGDQARAVAKGDAVAGKRVYQRAGCVACHRVDGAGSIYGPDLTRVGAARSLEYLRESLIKPSADVPQEWHSSTAVMKDGSKLTGIRINEDTFSLQLRDPSGRFRIFDKGELKDVTSDTASVMPAYDKLPAADLENLVAYLYSLRGAIAATGPATKAKGIQ